MTPPLLRPHPPTGVQLFRKNFSILLASLVALLGYSAKAFDGWTDVKTFIVPSDGTFSLGAWNTGFNTTRDQGSKIVYFDVENGDDTTAMAYWWHEGTIVDTNGSTTNPDNGLAYGTDPLNPNEAAIKAFKTCLVDGDLRLQTQNGSSLKGEDWRFSGAAAGYPDVFLFRRGQTHTEFNKMIAGGRSQMEPCVAAAYGPIEDGRAIIKPSTLVSPLKGHNWSRPRSWMHQAVFSLEIHNGYGFLGTHNANSFTADGGPLSLYMEDCYLPGKGGIGALPQRATVYRTIVAYSFNPDGHNQGYYIDGYKPRVTMEDVIFYKNGYKEDPVTVVDPIRDVFSRNIYQGGGSRLGHVYRNVISMDGASGGPQMRFGGVLENSLILEGYFYSSLRSNNNNNPWAEAEADQHTSTAIVRNNVQLIFKCNTPADPDLESQAVAQPGHGYSISSFTYGAQVEGNIITGAMLEDELGSNAIFGMSIGFESVTNVPGITLTQKNNRVWNNVFYKAQTGVFVEGNALGSENNVFEDNVVVSTNRPVWLYASNLTSEDQLYFRNNHFYSTTALPTELGVSTNNTLAHPSTAAATEGWSDPDRTLKRYVTEVLGLTILDWEDYPFYENPTEVQERIDAGEAYDPAGIRTFMAVASNMRQGGADTIPTSGKPSWSADYPWDERFTAIAVVNWIREGFGYPPIDPHEAPEPSTDEIEGFVDTYDGTYRAFIDQAHPDYTYTVQRSDELGQWRDLQTLQPRYAGFLSLEAEYSVAEDSTPAFYRTVIRPASEE